MCRRHVSIALYLEPEPADEEVEDDHGTRVEHPVGKVDGGAARHLGHDALQHEVGAGAGEGSGAAGVGRVRHREEHHVAHVHLFPLHFRGGGEAGVGLSPSAFRKRTRSKVE